MSERTGSDTHDPLTDPLAETISSDGGDAIEARRLRSNVRGALFGDEQQVRIGRYRLLDKLGEGGMGVVYKAHDDDLDRPVAIKLLRPDGGGTAQRLLREARSMARLAHPHIATIYDVGTHDDRVYIAMEFVDGPSLRQWIGAPHSFAEVAAVMLQAAQGLIAAHDAEVVHRDFKPDNVIVGNDGRVRVLDFGLAKFASPTMAGSTDGATATEAGRVMGTPRYMSPEQLRQQSAGPAADQFAYSVTLYEAVYGTSPFEGDVFAEVAASVLRGEPLVPPTGTTTPSSLWPVLRRGLAREANDRFGSMRELADALRAVAAQPDPAAVVSRPAMRDATEAAREQLAGAFAEDLLDADELDDRLERLEYARGPQTVGALVADLAPEPAALVPQTPPVSNVPAVIDTKSTGRVSAIFSGTKRAGQWLPARINKAVAIFGSVDLDFREVDFPAGVTTVEVQAVFGSVDIFVPPHVRVEFEADAVFGSAEQDDPSQAPDEDAPILRVTGFAFMGSVEVHERLSGEGAVGAWRRRRAMKKARRKEQKALRSGKG